MKKRSTADVWRERVAAWKSSGKTLREFVVGESYAAGTLKWWAYQIGKQEGKGAGRKASLEAPSMIRVVRRRARTTASVETQGVVLEVSGVRICVGHGFDRRLLREVVAALGGDQ